MENVYKRDGFNGERLIVIPTELFAPHADHPLIGRLYPTDAGFFPHAEGHYRKRARGCDEYILLYCMDGSGYIVLPSSTVTLQQGQALCIPRKMVHTYYADHENPWSLLWVHFKGSDSHYYPLHELSVIHLSQPKEQKRLLTLFDLLFTALEGVFTTGNLIHISQLLCALLSEVYFKEKSHTEDVRNHYFSKAVRFMHEHVNEELLLEDVAQHLMISKSYLHVLFRHYANRAPMEYFQELKIDMACQYLRMTDLRIEEVALQVGFSDTAYFSRRFKKIKQISPSSYRKQN